MAEVTAGAEAAAAAVRSGEETLELVEETLDHTVLESRA